MSEELLGNPNKIFLIHKRNGGDKVAKERQPLLMTTVQMTRRVAQPAATGSVVGSVVNTKSMAGVREGQLDRDRRQSAAHAQRLLSTSSSEGQLGRRATVGGRGEGLGGGGGGALGTAGEHGEPRKQQLVQQRAAAAPRADDPREQFGQGRGGEHSWERRGSGRGERRRRRRRRRKRRRKAGERSSLTRKCAHLRRSRRCCSLVRTSRKWVCRTCEILG